MAVARRGAVSLDYADARPLAESWAAMPGSEIVFTSAATAVMRTDWVALSAIEVPDYQPPTWPGRRYPSRSIWIQRSATWRRRSPDRSG